MTRYSMIFAEGDTPGDKDVGNARGLSADTIDDAEAKARGLPVPEGAKLIKLRDEGRVARRLWIEFDA